MKKVFTPKRFFFFSLVLATVLLISIYFSYKKLRESEKPGQTVVITEGGVIAASGPSTAPTNSNIVVPGALPETSPGKAQMAPGDVSKPFVNLRVPIVDPHCRENQNYSHLREDLGVLVNTTFDRREKPLDFAKQVDDFREKNGIPLPLGVSAIRLQREGVVYNNCSALCRGAVNQVFISRLVGNRFAEVMTGRGTFMQLPLHDSGLEIATIDELNAKGVPFRSWLAPMSDGPWYLKDNEIYYKLDIPGTALKISASNAWQVVALPPSLVKLDSVDPVPVSGCSRDEQCLVFGKRHFKAPFVCPSVVSHAADEPSDNTTVESSPAR